MTKRGSDILRVIAGLFAALGLTACASSASKPAPVGEVSVPTVELLGPGTAPFRVLRFTPKAGQRELMALTTTMGVGMSLGPGKTPPMTNMPPIAMTCEVETTEVRPDGTFRTRFAILAAQVEPDPTFPIDMAVALASAVEPLVGLQGTARMTDRGITLEAQVAVPADADPATRQLLDGIKASLTQLGVPLPIEAVGVGARWRVNSELDNAVRVRQTMMVELLELDATHATLRMSIAQSAARQRIKVAGLPATTVVDLTSLTGDGVGDVALDLGRLVPDSSHLEMRTLTKSLISGDGEELPMAMTMTVTVDIAPR